MSKYQQQRKKADSGERSGEEDTLMAPMNEFVKKWNRLVNELRKSENEISSKNDVINNLRTQLNEKNQTIDNLNKLLLNQLSNIQQKLNTITSPPPVSPEQLLSPSQNEGGVKKYKGGMFPSLS